MRNQSIFQWEFCDFQLVASCISWLQMYLQLCFRCLLAWLYEHVKFHCLAALAFQLSVTALCISFNKCAINQKVARERPPNRVTVPPPSVSLQCGLSRFVCGSISSSSNSSCFWNRAHIRRASIISEPLHTPHWVRLGSLFRTRTRIRILSMLCILHVAVVGDNNSNKSDDNNNNNNSNMAAKVIRIYAERNCLLHVASASFILPQSVASLCCLCFLLPAASFFRLLATWAQPLQKLVATRRRRCCNACTFFPRFLFPTSILATLKDRRLW